MKYCPQKTILQINYKPKLCYFERLYKNISFSDKFPHWETDRIRVTFKDYDNKCSLTMAHDKITFESDQYNREVEKDLISLLISEILNIVDDETFTRFGLRYQFLIKQELTFPELVEIINLKYFSENFKKLFDSEISDSAITIDHYRDNKKFKIIIGAMKKEEISRYIIYIINNHITPELYKRVEELNQIGNSFPDVSLFIDIDNSFSGDKLNKGQLEEFWKTAQADIPSITERIADNLFEEKIKL